jgi:aminomuconate-semialdehyde/2-hydroxymuconate-6-semialdehyde dehydrogenase
VRLQNYIDGQFQAPRTVRYLPVIEPATGAAYAEVPDSGEMDARAAVASAHQAAQRWASVDAHERARWLRRIAAGIAARLEEFAQAESRDTGKPIFAARTVDIPRAVQNFEFFASMADSFASEAHAQQGAGLHYTLRQPLGAVSCISPWNLPLYLLSWKIAPALAAGNTVVAKPSEITPLTAYLLATVLHEIGFPPGVLNILHGQGSVIGAAITQAPQIKAVSFTGSTATGALIAQGCASQFKKLSLEMGGKNALIVFADADIAMAADLAVRAAFSNQGQICLCTSRILVERSIYKEFSAAFVAATKALTIGDPADPETRFAALVSSAHLQKVESAVHLAGDEGGRIVLGGERMRLPGRCEQGYFYAPTIIDQLPMECATNQQEIFGPVATVMPFDDEPHAVLYANQSGYGLACSVLTQNLARAHRVADQLQAGLVWINSWMQRDLRVPFGGVKNSGLGREGGIDAMRFFTEAKSVFVAY